MAYKEQATGAGITNINVSAGTTSNNLSNLVFSNSNNVTFGLNGSTITASASGAGGADGVNIIAAGTQTANTTGTVVFSNSNGVTFGMSNSSVVTASHNGLTSQSNQALSGSNGSFTFQTATFGALNGLSFYTSNGSMVGSYTVPAAQTGISGVEVSNTTYTSGTVTFRNANGISFGSSGANGISASYTVPTVTNSSWTVSDAATSGSVARLAFTNLNGVTLSLSTGAGGSHTIVGSHNALTSQSNQAFSADASSTFQTLTFQDSNGISFSNNAGALRVTHALQYTSNTSNITSAALHTSVALRAIYDGANSISTGTIRLTNANGVSFSINGQTLSASVASQSNQTIGAYAVSNTTQSTSGTIDARSLSFQGAGVASVGVSNGSVVISVPAGGGGLTNINVSAGTTSQNLSNLVFSNSNGVSFGLSGSTITASAAAGGGGATMSQWPQGLWMGLATTSAYSGASTTTAGGSRTTVSVYVAPVVIDYAVTFNRVFAALSMGTVAGTGSGTNGFAYGLYTLNGGTLSLLTSWGMGIHISQSSVTARSHQWYWGTDSGANSSSVGGNISASVAKYNMAVMDTAASSLSPGQYWLAYAQTQRSSSVAVAPMSRFAASASQTTLGSMFGTNVSSAVMRYHGIVSTFTSNTRSNNVGDILPGSIHTSAVTATGGSSQNVSNMILFNSQ
jgi:hypothetical protein